MPFREGPPLGAQVLNYPSTDWTDTWADYPSFAENAHSVSPVKFENLAGLPPAPVIAAALDPVSDHGHP